MEKDEDIREFLCQLKQQAEQWKKMKIVFLGHGEVGKTSLLNALIDKSKNTQLRTIKNLFLPSPKIDVRDRTVGVDVSTLKIGYGGEASVWDFGGQLEYAVTHQFLLSIEMVVYVLCYDFSASEKTQNEQISYWLDFLQSTLPTTQFSHPTSPSNWQVIVVGTKIDQCKIKPQQHTLPIRESWKRLWTSLPLHTNQYIVSSHKIKGIDDLWAQLNNTCNTILDQHAILVPQKYNSLITTIQSIPLNKSIIPIKQLENACSWDDSHLFLLALKYFHAIGHVVLLHDLICINPQVIPKIMAEFISPESVRNKLVTNHRVEILDKGEIGAVLSVPGEHDTELDDKLILMEHIGVCFKLTNTDDTSSHFLFPSLASHKDTIQFTIEANELVKYAGMLITAPKNKVFTSAFFCLVIVQFCKILNISRRELVLVHKNGIVLQCTGIFRGQLLVKLEKDMRSIILLMLAFNPTLDFASHTIHQLIKAKFVQYDGYGELKLCPLCILPNLLQTEAILPAQQQTGLCMRHELHSGHKVQLSLIKKCKSHNSEMHHIFVSYRVESEGKKSPFMLAEGDGGFVELVYWKLAPQKLQHGAEVFVFWDKMCLNDGCNWEDGFLHGITSSNVIVLLLSNKVIEGICAKATTTQDNVLVEYECALLHYRKCGTPVLPVFVADVDQNGNFVEFNFGRNTPLPDAPHARKTRANEMITQLSDSLPTTQTEFLNSVSKTMDEIFHMQGIFMKRRGEDQDEMKALIQRIVAVLEKHHL
eukprot:Phypoly_transcript_03531.p1 GENE.Phypoly_transcript_03531~~Phypoly_transcript_03531.p1  ORF type:complete len:802 (+),score=106.01 Phypoly_transcript_03531:131-2407(+)